MTREEIETLLALLRKFNQACGESILEIEVKIVNYARSTPLFAERYAERERNER